MNTSIVKDVELPGGPYDLVLEHEKAPFISYPHEWSALMLKDAALFHLDLFRQLAPYGLTIKDMHPQNVVFDGARPVFVDFASLIPLDDLTSQQYLEPAARTGLISCLWDRQGLFVHEMYRRMFEPYLLLPLEMMAQGRHARARERMLATTLNASREVITRNEVFGRYTSARFAFEARDRLRKLSLVGGDARKTRFFRRLRNDVEALDVWPPESGYASYYEEKDEAFGFEPNDAWNAKQHTIFRVLDRLRAKTVLDLAGNTGWFAILAAKVGANVVSFDIDEACADVLYERAKRDTLPVLSLVLDSTKPTPDVPALEYEDEPKHYGDEAPLLLAATRRLKCELVMALAIVHHLALGQNRSFPEIVDMLDGFTGSHLAVEFVDKMDELIVAEREFFPAYKANAAAFGWYTEQNLVDELRKHFQRVEVLPSHPESRTILLCSRDAAQEGVGSVSSESRAET